MVGAAKNIWDRGARPAQLALNWEKDVHIVEDDQALTAFRVCLHRLVLIHRTPEAKAR